VRFCYIAGSNPIEQGDRRRIVGPAFTLRFTPTREDLATVDSWSSPRSTRAAIEDMPEGCVAVADAMGSKAAGIFGDILCARMAKKGVATGVEGPVEVWHREILRQVAGVRTTVATATLMTELGRQPMCFAWLKQAAKMWNKFCSRNISDLARIALVESAEMASVPRKRERVGWVTQLNKTLHLRRADFD
jgi:hypothetical protein